MNERLPLPSPRRCIALWRRVPPLSGVAPGPFLGWPAPLWPLCLAALLVALFVPVVAAADETTGVGEGREASAEALLSQDREMGRSEICAVQDQDALLDLLPLKRPCLAVRPCAIALEEPASPRGELLAEAERLAAMMALTLSRREAVCVDDAHGRWSKIAGEPLKACPHGEARHRLLVRLDPDKDDGLVASATFTEAGDATQTAPIPTSTPKLIPTPTPTARTDQTPSNESAPPAPASQAPALLFSPEPQRLRLRTRLDEPREVTFAAEELANALGDALGTERPSAFDFFLQPLDAPFLHLNVKLGNTLAALDGFDFSAFTLRFDLEVDYYLRPYLLAFLEVGLAIGNAENSDDAATDESASANESEDGNSAGEAHEKNKGSFSLVPVKIGLKYNPLHQYSVRPYIGAAIGLGILSDLVEAESREITLSLSGILGVAWVPFNQLGFNFETSFNFDELRISGGSNVLFGFSINFGVLILF